MFPSSLKSADSHFSVETGNWGEEEHKDSKLISEGDTGTFGGSIKKVFVDLKSSLKTSSKLYLAIFVKKTPIFLFTVVLGNCVFCSLFYFK